MKQPFQIFFLLCLIAPTCFARLVENFSQCDFFVNSSAPVIPGILEDGVIQPESVYRGICQEYPPESPADQFATVYDTSKKIPVFSAYIYTGKHDYMTTRAEQRLLQFRTEDQLGESQAQNADYDNLIDNGYNRGHLFPKAHAHDKNQYYSTMTLTNIVPQNATFNSGRWSRMETAVKRYIKIHCKDTEAYVVTGAAGVHGAVAGAVAAGVAIPELMWTAFCCNTKKFGWASTAHWAANVDEPEPTMLRRSLPLLNDKLKEYYGGTVKVFPEECEQHLKV